MHICIYGVLIAIVLLFSLIVFIVNWRRRRFQVKTTNRSVLVTGCDTGFGHHIAKQLCSRGFIVFAGCLNSTGIGAKDLSKYSKNIHVLQLDVTKDEQVSRSLSCVENSLGDKELWAIINNAGVALGSPECEWCPLDQYQCSMDVNLFGTIRVTKTFLPLIRKSQGRIINVASIAGRFGVPGFSAYSATKFGLIGYSECLRKEMSKFNVKVVTIEPSMYRTSITETSRILEQNKKSWQNSPEIVKNEYGEDYFKAYQTHVKQGFLEESSDDISPVLDAMEDAVCSSHPKITYIPETFHYLRTGLLLTLPYNVQEYILTIWLKTVSCRPKCIELKNKMD